MMSHRASTASVTSTDGDDEYSIATLQSWSMPQSESESDSLDSALQHPSQQHLKIRPQHMNMQGPGQGVYVNGPPPPVPASTMMHRSRHHHQQSLTPRSYHDMEADDGSCARSCERSCKESCLNVIRKSGCRTPLPMICSGGRIDGLPEDDPTPPLWLNGATEKGSRQKLHTYVALGVFLTFALTMSRRGMTANQDIVSSGGLRRTKQSLGVTNSSDVVEDTAEEVSANKDSADGEKDGGEEDDGEAKEGEEGDIESKADSDLKKMLAAKGMDLEALQKFWEQNQQQQQVQNGQGQGGGSMPGHFPGQMTQMQGGQMMQMMQPGQQMVQEQQQNSDGDNTATFNQNGNEASASGGSQYMQGYPNSPQAGNGMMNSMYPNSPQAGGAWMNSMAFPPQQQQDQQQQQQQQDQIQHMMSQGQQQGMVPQMMQNQQGWMMPQQYQAQMGMQQPQQQQQGQEQDQQQQQPQQFMQMRGAFTPPAQMMQMGGGMAPGGN